MVEQYPMSFSLGQLLYLEQFFTETATVQTEKMTANVVLVPLRIIKAESPYNHSHLQIYFSK